MSTTLLSAHWTDRAHRSARHAMLAVFNLRSVAFVLSVCAVLATAVALDCLVGCEEGSFVIKWLRSFRQNGITGASALVGIAACEALRAAQSARDRAPARWAFVVDVAIIASCVALGVTARRAAAIFFNGLGNSAVSYFVGAWILWCIFAMVGLYVIRADREHRAAQVELDAIVHGREVLEAQAMQARLAALHAQIEPHFLFNTLANVRRLYEVDAPQGRHMLANLIAYLRAALPSMRSHASTLACELDLVRAYLNVLQIRMGERLVYAIDAEAAVLNATMPPMVLPTLVENAIKHGLSPLPGGGRIDVVARRDADDLCIEVNDDGAGFRDDAGAGVGLANTRARLTALYGGRASLQLHANQPRGVCARIRLPLEAAERAA